MLNKLHVVCSSISPQIGSWSDNEDGVFCVSDAAEFFELLKIAFHHDNPTVFVTQLQNLGFTISVQSPRSFTFAHPLFRRSYLITRTRGKRFKCKHQQDLCQRRSKTHVSCPSTLTMEPARDLCVLEDAVADIQSQLITLSAAVGDLGKLMNEWRQRKRARCELAPGGAAGT